jgi:hypothetical protein
MSGWFTVKYRGKQIREVVMFFIFGISNGEKKLNFLQTIVCSDCGQFGRLELYMTYMYFSLFFIPIFKWGRRYYVKSSCCHTVYELDRELGRRLHRGETVNLTEEELHAAGRSYQAKCGCCPSCGYTTAADFDYCPKCGRRL